MLIEATQVAQDAQAGYACDSCTQRQPLAFDEVKKCCTGPITLVEHLRQELLRLGKRHASCIMNDVYGKGIVRGQVENTNVRAYTRDHDVTAAEYIQAGLTDNFFGQQYADLIQRLNAKRTSDRSTVIAEVDMRSTTT